MLFELRSNKKMKIKHKKRLLELSNNKKLITMSSIIHNICKKRTRTLSTLLFNYNMIKHGTSGSKKNTTPAVNT